METRLILVAVLAVFALSKYEVATHSPLQIVDGTTAKDGEFPYMVQVRDDIGSFQCAGAIIGDKWILTSGYCVIYCLVESVIVGTNEFYDEMNGTLKIKTCHQHPKFPDWPIYELIYDIGILELKTPISFSDVAQPVKLPEANESIPFHVQGVLSGWGANESYSVDMDKYLQKINLELQTDDECSEKLKDNKDGTFNSTHNICTNDNYNGACMGDNADPFVINGTLYGLVSWAPRGRCGSYPTVYSRIVNPEYRNWITKVTNI